MHEIPDCLNRRYQALDELVKDLGTASDGRVEDLDENETGFCCNYPGLRLMCDFWNILKENPDCNLTKAVQSRLDVCPKRTMFQPQNVSCYMAAHNCMKKDENASKSDTPSKPITECCHKGADPKIKTKCCASKSVSSSQGSSDVLPLSKVLCNLKEAASFDRKCQGMVTDLMSAQKELQDQIQHLEHREKEGIQLLKQADCMWSCMEDAYKKKILESQERQQELIKQLKEAEANTNKWRKNKKDLEFQMENINRCHQEITEKLNQKQNDLKCMNRDITDYKKRIENNKKELEAAKKSVATKKKSCDDKIKTISGDISIREAKIRDERAYKQNKEQEGNQYIKEARADLLNLSKVLLQKKIENQELMTEKETLIDELEILSQSYDQCKDRCQTKKQSIENEIKIIDTEIANYKAKCIRCHQCTDTIDIRKFCTDCPRCIEDRECLYSEDHCSPDHSMDCVCMSVKQKFLDNVFENMYTVLERQIKTGPGKCIAETVLTCLKRSRNGKLDQETRQILQDFILTTVKKNLNLTIVGGAVKTRCELDPDTYKQLMLCLKQVKAVRPPKADKQTAAKKPPCARWGGETECNCPKGPKACICTKRAPPPPSEPGPCPPPDKEDKGEEKVCPYKESAACGPDCAMHAVPSAVGHEVAAWRPDPCQDPTCSFKNMRAAQCVLGPEALNSTFNSRSFVTGLPHLPNIGSDVETPCRCGSSPMKLCTCKDTKQMKVDVRTQYSNEVCGLNITSYGKELLNTKAIPQDLNTDLIICGKHGTRITDKTKINEANKSDHVIVDSEIKADLIKEQFKPLLYTKSIQNEDKFFENNEKKSLKNNAKNTTEVSKKDIDEKIIELIDNITKEDPSNFVSLRKTQSGHLILGFNSVSDNDGQSIVVKRSGSGSMVIEIDKITARNLSAKKCKHKLKMKENSENTKDAKTYKPYYPELKTNSETKIIKKAVLDSTENFSVCKSNQLLVTQDFLKNMYSKGQQNIDVRVTSESKELINIKGILIQMSNESIAIHIKNANFVNNNNVKSLVTLLWTKHKILNIGFDDNAICNGVAVKTASNGLMVYTKQSNIQDSEPIKSTLQKPEDVYKIKIKGLDNNVKEPPAVIKETTSGNFEVILEKEFEKYYTQTIQREMMDGSESYFNLTKTSSSVILDFDKNKNIRSHSQKAFLMKSNSGLLKIIVSNAAQNSSEEILRKNKSLTLGSNVSAKALNELLGKLPSNPKILKDCKNKADPIKTKSTSDSNLYESAKIKLHSNQSLLEKSSSSLKKTPSGQYAIILDKESKRTFINNLLSFLEKSSKDVIPIKKRNTGEIIIDCDNNDEVAKCGSLKITPSGNIYLVLNETIANRICNNVGVSTSCISNRTDISPYLSKIDYLDNKSISTNCNANPYDSLCDVSKCVCEHLIDVSNTVINIDKVEHHASFKTCGKAKCSDLPDRNKLKSNDKPPHIVIRPQDRSQSDKCHESYYCELQSVCPFHKDRYEAVSNELLEISGPCKNSQEYPMVNVEKYTTPKHYSSKTTDNEWDSFEYLPHQLPTFLRNTC